MVEVLGARRRPRASGALSNPLCRAPRARLVPRSQLLADACDAVLVCEFPSPRRIRGGAQALAAAVRRQRPHAMSCCAGTAMLREGLANAQTRVVVTVAQQRQQQAP